MPLATLEICPFRLGPLSPNRALDATLRAVSVAVCLPTFQIFRKVLESSRLWVRMRLSSFDWELSLSALPGFVTVTKRQLNSLSYIWPRRIRCFVQVCLLKHPFLSADHHEWDFEYTFGMPVSGSCYSLPHIPSFDDPFLFPHDQALLPLSLKLPH